MDIITYILKNLLIEIQRPVNKVCVFYGTQEIFLKIVIQHLKMLLEVK